jgi:AcrR family transcriptional regulator
VAAARPLFAAGRRPQVADIARAAGLSRATFYRHFRSREELESELEVEPETGSRERVLEAALDLIGRDGLARLSMDEVAERAGLSRASLYRLFPGKAALFKAVVVAYSPLQPVSETLARLQGRPPEEVMPEIARTAVRALQGRSGLIRSLLLEVAGGSADSGEAAEAVLGGLVGPLLGYVLEQMQAGRLRPMHPLLALQAFIGPIFFHLVTREVAAQRLGVQLGVEDAATELALNWLASMRRDGP